MAREGHERRKEERFIKEKKKRLAKEAEEEAEFRTRRDEKALPICLLLIWKRVKFIRGTRL